METPNLNEIIRLIKVLNGDIPELETDKIISGDIPEALNGNKIANRRSRVTLQKIKALIIDARKELFFIEKNS